MESLEGKRLVVFGAGYIGGEVARQALSRGARVTALTRNHATAERLRQEGIATVVGDLASREWHGQITGGADYVLNAVSSGGGGKAGYHQSYVQGMQSVLDWAKSTTGVGTLVYTSSTSVYPQDHGVSVDESAPTEGAGELPQVLLEAENLLQGASSWSNSERIHEACRNRSFHRWFILRLAGIYGPGRHYLVDQVRSGVVAGRGEHHLNLAHRDDIVSAIWAAFESPDADESGIFNVSDDKAARKEEIVAWLAQKLGVAMPTFTGVPAAGRRAVTPDRVILNTKLRTRLSWRPRFPTFREGYKNMLALSAE